MDRKRERKKRERARQVGAAVLQQPRGRSDLIGCGSDSLNSSTTFQRARARGRNQRAKTRTCRAEKEPLRDCYRLCLIIPL